MLDNIFDFNAPTKIALDHRVDNTLTGNNGTIFGVDTRSLNASPHGPAMRLSMLHDLVGSGVNKISFIYNKTGRDVSVIGRNGIRNVVKPIPGVYEPVVIIRQVDVVQDVASPRLDQYYLDKTTPQYGEEEFGRVREYYLSLRSGQLGCRDPNKPHYMFSVSDATVPMEVLTAHPAVYVSNRDVLLSYQDVDKAPAHPFDHPEAYRRAIAALFKGGVGVGMVYDIVDSQSAIGGRYAVFGKRVSYIPSRVDPNRPDGVYLYRVSIVGGEQKIVTETYPLSEAEEKLGLYRTEQEAISGGDVRVLREKELETVRHDHKLLESRLKELQLHKEQELQAVKIEAARSELAHKEQLQKLEHENKIANQKLQAMSHTWELQKLQYTQALDQHSMEHKYREMDRRDYYEARSHERKDRSEEFKFWPVVITGCLAAGAGLMAAFQGRKS